MIPSGIAREHIELVWPWFWPLILPAYRHSDDQPGPEEILRQIKGRQLQAWTVWSIDRPVAGILSKLILGEVTSGELHCHLWLIAGSRLNDWASDFLSVLVPWAKAEGCTAITTSSKRGWGRRPARYGFVRIEDRDGFPTWARAI